MIYYFSATGNSKYVAEILGERLGEKTVDIRSVSKEEICKITIEQGEVFGLVTPTYYWGLPVIVADFLKNAEISLKGKKYLFLVATYGTVTGQLAYQAQSIMNKKGMPFDAFFGIKTVDNYVPLFSVIDTEANKAKIKESKDQALVALEKIKSRQTGLKMPDSIFFGLSAAVYQSYERKRKTKNFFVEDSCVGCGECAFVCPINAIELKGGKPAWVKEKCVLCLGCLHHCPNGSINYIKKNKNGQYVLPEGGVL